MRDGLVPGALRGVGVGNMVFVHKVLRRRLHDTLTFCDGTRPERRLRVPTAERGDVVRFAILSGGLRA